MYFFDKIDIKMLYKQAISALRLSKTKLPRWLDSNDCQKYLRPTLTNDAALNPTANAEKFKSLLFHQQRFGFLANLQEASNLSVIKHGKCISVVTNKETSFAYRNLLLLFNTVSRLVFRTRSTYLPKNFSSKMEQLHTPSSYSFQRCKTSDSDEHAASLGKWDQIYDQLTPGTFSGEVTDIWFEGMQIFRETINQSVSQSGTTWKGSFVLGIPVGLKSPGVFAKQILTQDSILAFRGNSDFTLTTSGHFDAVCVAVPEEALINALQPHSSGDLNKLFPASPSVLVMPPGKLDELRNCLLSIFDPSNFEPGLLAYPQIQKAMCSAIIGHLAEVLGTASQAPPPSRSFKGRLQVVREATDYALSHTTDPITVGDLCEKLNISRRMLNYCFTEVYGINPVQYLRTLRLNGVRRELRNTSATTSAIRDIASKWGFWHLSRFAAEYRELFGELPSNTHRGLYS